MALALAPGFGYVALTAAAAFGVHNMYMSFAVGAARKKYGIKYPHLYATVENCKDEANRNAFNCVQRGHQNSLENLPSFYMLLTTAGLRYPITAAVAGVIYLIGKIVYFQSYSTGDASKRMRGAFSYIGLFTLLGATIRMGLELIRS